MEEEPPLELTSQMHGLTVATRNEHDFALFDVPVSNPFRSAS
jgi:hypothetical protein